MQTSDQVHLGATGNGDESVQPPSLHTPGPWSFREWMHTDEELAEIRQHEAAGMSIHPVACTMNDGARIVMAGSNRVALVDCQTQFKRGHGSETECAERDANARLIAAAPELLEFAQQLAARGIADKPTMDKCRAAIAKATGTPS